MFEWYTGLDWSEDRLDGRIIASERAEEIADLLKMTAPKEVIKHALVPIG